MDGSHISNIATTYEPLLKLSALKTLKLMSVKMRCWHILTAWGPRPIWVIVRWYLNFSNIKTQWFQWVHIVNVSTYSQISGSKNHPYWYCLSWLYQQRETSIYAWCFMGFFKKLKKKNIYWDSCGWRHRNSFNAAQYVLRLQAQCASSNAGLKIFFDGLTPGIICRGED